MNHEEVEPLALTECGHPECNNLIGDFQDEYGGFYRMVSGKYVPLCRDCFGPLTGDR